MSSNSLVRVLNVLMRGVTLLCKFLLIFFLAKFLEPNDVGLYGLLAGTIGYALFAVGFEFYTYSTRELIGSDRQQWLALIRDQSVFFFFTYLFVLPFALMAFFSGLLPWSYAGWFFLLLILEHVAQELNRLLVVISEQLLASVILFLRSGAWCLLLALLMWWVPETRKLEWVLGAWCIGAGLGCLLGGARILSLNKAALRSKVDWQWIGKGLRLAIPLLIASLAIRGVFTFDRYWVESIVGLDVLGVYVLFIGIATSIVSFLDAGVVVFLYPKIVAAAKVGDDKAFCDGMKKLFSDILLVTLVLVGLALVVSRPILAWIDKDIYMENLYLLKWLFLAIVLYAASMVPHVGLYAHGQDRAILFSQLCGLAVFCLGVYWGASSYGVVMVPWALCLSFLAYCAMRNGQGVLI
jgi:O-antigen/teichoic acid export membrane protein